MRRREAWLPAVALAMTSPSALAHDGGVVAVITFTVIATTGLGIVGGTLSGWFGRRLTACMGGTLVACGAGVLGIELMTDGAVAKNFWPNIVFLASFAVVPMIVAYSVTHVVGRVLRGARRTRQEAPDSTAESDA